MESGQKSGGLEYQRGSGVMGQPKAAAGSHTGVDDMQNPKPPSAPSLLSFRSTDQSASQMCLRLPKCPLVQGPDLTFS